MPKQTNVLEFIPELPKHPLFRELKEINSHSKKYKLRARKSSSGKYIFYLEYFSKGKRTRDYIELY